MQHENPDYQLHIETPTVEDYRRLRLIAGMSPKSEEAALRGLPNTLFAVTIHFQDETVGMGRIVGDGGCFYQIVDIAVDPAHQGKGLGKMIMAALVDYVKTETPAGAYISLIADGPAQYLYAKYGFEPVTPASIGMALPVRKA
ncbi:GNAT family N-acetyltransferase [Phyllobacterium sp. 628]|uniref:GNAT family N-acetyltransferase n=1 Tax=Phyllobacterium sp. 628 TaxID=2718938 RepID=UPI0016627644|nr:GNAT family N-acetyltransferase [Phyllobacterium sp. 628]QND52833.1 GNAT family N-acetyltransferase [Phyllobacterium sp. 628]